MTTWIALFRGLNVGGKNKLKMADLRTTLAAMPVQHVRTYIQSGNAIFASALGAEALAATIRGAVCDAHGIETSVMLRDAETFHRIAAAHPFAEGADERRLAVAFLEEAPAASSVAEFDETCYAPDVCALQDRQVFVFAPSGFGKTRLTNSWLEKQLGVPATTRNWRTVRKLSEMAQ